MNSSFVTSFFVVAALLAPLAVVAAEEGSKDRTHPGAFVKDSIITTKIKTKLAGDKMRSLTHIRVDTDANGMVVLSGSAKTAEDVAMAGTIARGIEGVTSVRNDIKIKKDE